ncbi:hypothetical protein HPP92_025445 [Vanilla planifolia]|uniref:4-coumarate--CoA ligase n=1 Tax=Vanilla planifolia TaxID=51239 RepID=A0A835PL14_VANPL|nr:hypothetical protein HPP92_025445 [Vanilla planifolia]
MDRLGSNSANSSPLTPLGFLERTAVVYGDRPSVVYNSKVYTWAETRRRCLRLASALYSRLGISPGSVVSVLAPNTPPMYEMHFGVPMSGAVLNTINIRLDARTVSVILRHSGSRVLFCDLLFLSLARAALDLLPSDHSHPLLIPIDDSFEDASILTGFELTYEKLLDLGDPEFLWIRPKSEWSPMILNYTSGTTAAPKGVVHCHRGICLVSLDSLIDWCVPQHPVYLWTLPMFHSNGWCFPWAIASVAGTNVCLRSFDGPTVFAAIADNRVTHVCGAPVVLNMIANTPPSTRRQLPGTVRILTAGAPPPAAVLARVESLGFVVSHGYGLTETGGLVVSCAWKGDHWDRLPAGERARMKARQGVRTPIMTAMDVVDGATAQSVPWDGKTLGEVVLRGGHLMLGYLKDEEATARAIKDGWFYTGDVGVMHPDGYLEIKDRSKDVIISGGENISSVEVESVMYGHPSVNEASVVARPDKYWGETPCAFVGLKSGLTDPSPTEAEFITWCRERMPHYMAPRTVVFLPELPKTSTGKIQKYALRDMAKNLGPSATASAAEPPRPSKL